MSSRFPQLVVASAFVVIGAAPRAAFAQTTTTLAIANAQSLPRLDANLQPIDKRPSPYTPEGVSYADCVQDQQIEFPLQMSGFQGSAVVEVWASVNGADCGPAASRAGATAECWKVLGSDIALTTAQNVDIPVRSIMAGASPNSPLSPNSAASVCGLVDLTDIQVQFLYFAPENPSQAATTRAVTVRVDTVGPPAPAGISTSTGAGRVSVTWENDGGDTSQLTGVRVYCDDQGNTSVPTSPQCAALRADTQPAGADDAGSTGACTNENLAPASGVEVVPTSDFDECFLCGSVVGNGVTSVTASTLRGAPLIANHDYAVAIAATDAFNNVGLLSPLACDAPEEGDAQTDKAGGGGCDASGNGTPSAALGAILAIGLSLVRRRSTNP